MLRPHGANCQECTLHTTVLTVVPPSVRTTQGSGNVIYLGFDFTEPITPWVHMLIAATQFQEFDIKSRGV